MLHKPSPRFVSRLTRETLALVLAGGRGSRLHELTDWRAKPAVPFGGKFRIIDFPLSNCINSGIRRVGILTQYKSHSLIKHITGGWNFLRGEFGEYIDLLPAQQRMEGDSWYQGTADAITQNLDILRQENFKYVLVLAGDHIYKMDYGPMLAAHVEKEADVTVGCFEIPIEQASAFGVMSVDEDGKILEFSEKPENPAPMPGNPECSLGSMGIYVFSAKYLFDQLVKDRNDPDSEHDFGKNIIPNAVKNDKTYAFASVGPEGKQEYWRDVGTIDSYWQANIELVDVSPELNLYDTRWPIWTYQIQAPPAKFVFNDDGRRGHAVDSMVSGGCIISGAHINRSLLFSNVRVADYTEIEESVILPEVTIGENCVIKKAIIDRHCDIAPGTKIGVDAEEDRKRFRVTDKGVVLVTPEMLGQCYHQIN